MANIVITETGPLWDLDDVKLAIKVDGNDEDTIIEAYMAAAEAAMLRFCNLSLVPFGQEAVFKAAGFITVAALFDNRSGELDDGIPTAARKLIWPYRWLPI